MYRYVVSIDLAITTFLPVNIICPKSQQQPAGPSLMILMDLPFPPVSLLATEDDVISLFSTLDISDDGDDGLSTSIATNSHPITIPIPKCTTNLFQAELDALADASDNAAATDDDDAMDSPLLPPPRQGKQLLHHSLTRRDRSAPSFASSHTMVHHDE